MSLCGEDEHTLKDVLADMKKQNGTGETSLWALGKLLWMMGKLDLAEHYYSRLLQEIPSNDPSRRSLYADLSQIASQQGDYDKSVWWRQKSLEMKEQATTSNSLKSDISHDCIQIADNDLKLHEEIGSGAFGTVYRATWISRRYTVAVKKLHLTHLTDTAEKEFFKELSLMHSIRCPYIINFYAACTETGKYALVMEYMSLGSLYKILHEDNLDLSWSERLSIAFQAASGINYLHQLPEPVLHRDIKSLNFLIERAYEGYTVKVCGFGLARTRNETTCQTTSNPKLVCKLQWTAPEILCMKKHTHKSDVYSLGIVYWELAADEIPYAGHQDAVICQFVLHGDRLEIPKTTPSRFSSLIKKCWAHDPNDRPNCPQLIEIIEECITKQSNFVFVGLL
ncbi:unnamed protein product [Rotaria sp. Silwood2]|nr:unnamed protein product [Rotaria sp. Silwood2]CAF3383386.1 unnamed protein product [Rotaria sp. Silwood2]CAF4242184.1 unnamed protein product [Rotaria sp. Silwood2]CAF4558182.1 unnamed protein product [Rotaria sp. Silwood2]